jgi:hypothetical protein
MKLRAKDADSSHLFPGYRMRQAVNLIMATQMCGQ